MNKGLRTLIVLFAALALPAIAQEAKLPKGFVASNATVNGARIHYMLGGKGPVVVLLHGYAQTSQMWKPLMPVLASTHTVIVPDLPGVGGWQHVWLLRDLWHFHFYGETPLALVKGRERIYFEHFWNDFAADRTK